MEALVVVGRPIGLQSFMAGRVSQRGYGLLELTVTLVVISALAVGAFAGLRQQLDDKLIETESEWTLRAIDELDKRFATFDSYRLLGMDRLSSLQAIPSGLLQAAPLQLNTSFGGTAWVAPLSVGGVGPDRAFGWTISGMPQRLCADFVNALRAGNPFALAVEPEPEPNSVRSVRSFKWSGSGVTNVGDAVVVKPSADEPIDLVRLASTAACGTRQPTVSLTFIRLKR